MVATTRARKPKEKVLQVYLGDPVEDYSTEIIEGIMKAPKGASAVIFYINCGGGQTCESDAIIQMLRIRKLKSIAVVLSDCSSSALDIFANADKRYVTPSSTFLIHALTWEPGKERKTPEEYEAWLDEYKRSNREVADTEYEKLFKGKVDREEYERWLKCGKYLTGRELIEMGVAEPIPDSGV